MKDKLVWNGYKYLPNIGKFIHIETKKVAVSKNGQGYITLCLNGDHHRAHRIAYEITVGSIPEDMEIDHINGNRADNRIANLRIVTARGNAQNKKIHRHTDKLVGCSKCSLNRWRAQVYHRGKKKYLGTYDTELEAHTAYLNFLDKHGIKYLKEIDKRPKT